MKKNARWLQIVILIGCAVSWCSAGAGEPAWRSDAQRTSLKNASLEAHFQAGILCRLRDVATGKELLSVDPAKLPSQLLILDTAPVNLDECTVSTEASTSSVTTRYQLPGGDQILLKWTIEPAKGD